MKTGNLCKIFTVCLISFIFVIFFSLKIHSVYAYDQKYNVCDFGANGNDTKDDSEAIQECLDKANENSGTTQVIVPKGKYYLNKSLVIYSNTILTLDTNTTMYNNDTTTTMLTTLVNKSIGGYNQASNITVEGGTWDGNVKDTTTLTVLIRFNHATNITLKNCSVKNFCARHAVVFAGVNKIKVNKVKISNAITYTGKDSNHEYYPYEGQKTIDYEVTKSHMEALHIDSISKDGFSEGSAYPLDGTANKNVSVQNCTFENVYAGIGDHYFKQCNQAENFTIKNNTFKNIKYNCINAYNYKNINISDNKATNARTIVECFKSTGVIDNNSITARKYSYKGKDIYASAISINNSSVSLSNNTINKGQYHGVSIGNKSTVTMNKNVIKNSVHNGINVNDSTATLTNNTISSSTENGITINQAKGSITKNKISSCKNDGIMIYDNSTVKNCNNNVITNITSRAIDIIKKSTVTNVKNNTIKNCNSYGILVYGKSKVTTMDNNNITKSKLQAIDLADSSKVTTISNNIIDNTSDAGITIGDSTANLKSNTISNTKKNSISYINSKGKIQNNNCSSTKMTGISIYKCNNSNEVSGNTIRSPKQCGIEISSSKNVKVLNNSITNSGSHSINIYKSSKTTVNKNIVKKSKLSGINIYSSTKITANINTILNSKKKDLSISNNSTGIAKNNTITSSKSYYTYNKSKFSIKSNKYKK